jgi:hypothetical protein
MKTYITQQQIQQWANTQKPSFVTEDMQWSWQTGLYGGLLWSLLNGTKTAENLKARILASQPKDAA